MKKRILAFIFVFSLLLNNTYALESQDLFNIYYQWNVNRQDIYIVPPWKDLIINFLYCDTTTNAQLFLRDNGFDIAWAWFVDNKNEVKLLVKDLLQLKDSSSANNYVITWFLVNEGDDITGLITWNDPWINKQIFDEATILEIYQYEGIIMIAILFYTFFMRILWVKRKRKPFWYLFKKYWL